MGRDTNRRKARLVFRYEIGVAWGAEEKIAASPGACGGTTGRGMEFRRW